MDFSLQPDTHEISAFRKEVRDWLAENMLGSEHLRWSARWSTRENDEEYKFRRDLANKLGQKRWLFPTYPVEYGGAGLSLDHQFVLETEIDRYGLPINATGAIDWQITQVLRILGCSFIVDAIGHTARPS